MKLLCQSQNRRTGERGFFLVVVLLIIASIMLIYVAANGRRLTILKKEIRLVEQKQIQRLNRSEAVVPTNASLATILPAAAQ